MNDLSVRNPPRTGPMPFNILLDEGMRRTRRHFRQIYPAVAVPVVVAAGVSAVFQAFWFQRMVGEMGSSPPQVWSWESILMSLLYGIVLGLGTVAMQKAAVDASAGRPVAMGEAWRFVAQPRVLGTLALQFLAILGSALACFFPVLYVAPLLAFATPAMVDEGVFGGRALARSAELTRYNPERRFFDMPMVKVLALMIVAVVISYAVALLVAIPFQIPMYVDIFRQAAAGTDPLGGMAKWLWLQVPAQMLSAAATLAVSLYLSFGTALLFFDTRDRKEGSDLAAEIHEVFGPGSPAGEPAP